MVAEPWRSRAVAGLCLLCSMYTQVEGTCAEGLRAKISTCKAFGAASAACETVCAAHQKQCGAEELNREELGEEDKDAGYQARCKTTLPGVTPGARECKLNSNFCNTKHGWTNSEVNNYASKCPSEWAPLSVGGQYGCPDGIGPRGFYLGTSCAKWDAPCALSGMMGCFTDGGYKVCSKMQIQHIHGTARNIGLLQVKRVACKNNICKVFKHGKCLDVGTNVFTTVWNDHANMPAQLKTFAVLAQNNLEAGTKAADVAQSSTAWGGSASRAIDGNVANNISANSCTHTNLETNPWWRVDLTSSKTVRAVTVYNRGDCCGDRLSAFQVRVGNSATWSGNTQCGGSHSVAQGKSKSIACGNKAGRYVHVVIPGANKVLTLCEVVVQHSYCNDANVMSRAILD